MYKTGLWVCMALSTVTTATYALPKLPTPGHTSSHTPQPIGIKGSNIVDDMEGTKAFAFTGIDKTLVTAALGKGATISPPQTMVSSTAPKTLEADITPRTPPTAPGKTPADSVSPESKPGIWATAEAPSEKTFDSAHNFTPTVEDTGHNSSNKHSTYAAPNYGGTTTQPPFGGRAPTGKDPTEVFVHSQEPNPYIQGTSWAWDAHTKKWTSLPL